MGTFFWKNKKKCKKLFSYRECFKMGTKDIYSNQSGISGHLETWIVPDELCGAILCFYVVWHHKWNPTLLERIVNGLGHLYHLSTLVTFTHSHTFILWRQRLPWKVPTAHRRQFWAQYLPQGHFNMQLEEQPAPLHLLNELHLLNHFVCLECCNTGLLWGTRNILWTKTDLVL